MIGLLIDTSCVNTYIAIIKNNKILFCKSTNKIFQQSKKLNLVVNDLINCLELNYKKLNFICVIIDQAKFTSLKISISLANALYLTLKIPLIAVLNFNITSLKYQKLKLKIISKKNKKFYFKKYNKIINLFHMKILNKILKIKNQTHLIKNVNQINKFILNDKSIAKLSSYNINNMKIFTSNYINEKHIINK